MYAKVMGAACSGLNGIPITVEADLDRGLPNFEIVGLANTAVKEARERVRTALKNSGFRFPRNHITVNLAPASLRKHGSGLDLAIALGILAASGCIPRERLTGSLFLGELSLDGALRPVQGVLPMALAAREAGVRTLYVPPRNGAEGALVEGLEVYALPTLRAVTEHLQVRAGSAPWHRWYRRQPGRTIPMILPTSGASRMPNGAWKWPPPAATISFSSARPAAARPCWPGACLPSCRP